MIKNKEELARLWHEVSDHGKDGTPFGGGLCNCFKIAERALPLLALSWGEGYEAGEDDGTEKWNSPDPENRISANSNFDETSNPYLDM